MKKNKTILTLGLALALLASPKTSEARPSDACLIVSGLITGAIIGIAASQPTPPPQPVVYCPPPPPSPTIPAITTTVVQPQTIITTPIQTTIVRPLPLVCPPVRVIHPPIHSRPHRVIPHHSPKPHHPRPPAKPSRKH